MLTIVFHRQRVLLLKVTQKATTVNPVRVKKRSEKNTQGGCSVYFQESSTILKP